jgi:hypothetical protein
MAKIRAGILGNLRGKVAGVVGGQYKDVNYVREYVKPANPQTDPQLAQRALMRSCVSFCKPLVGPVFNEYTDVFQKHMSGFNYFVKKNISLFTTTPVYSSIKITEGKLWGVHLNACVYDHLTGVVALAWSTSLGNNGFDDDKVYAAVVYKSNNLWFFADEEADRVDGTMEVQADTTTTYDEVAAFIFAIRRKAGSPTIVEMISDSSYKVATAA